MLSVFNDSFLLSNKDTNWFLFLIIVFYYQIKTLISFWYRQRLNLKSLIQSLENLPAELTKTHMIQGIEYI